MKNRTKNSGLSSSLASCLSKTMGFVFPQSILQPSDGGYRKASASLALDFAFFGFCNFLPCISKYGMLHDDSRHNWRKDHVHNLIG